MNERRFQMRLFSLYQEPDNTISDLRVELFADEAWQDFDLNTGTAGFLIFVYAVFSCQHMYMRLNCAERGLMLGSASGHIAIEATQDWLVTRQRVAFEGRLKSGVPSAADVEYIIERMKHCPVSSNLHEVPDSKTSLVLR
jgi:hypothetical protein